MMPRSWFWWIIGTHRRAQAAGDDRPGAGEARIHHRVHGHTEAPLWNTWLMMVVDRLIASSGPPVLTARGPAGGSRVHQQDHAAVGRQQLEGLVEQPGQQLVDVGLEADGTVELVGDAQLLVVALELLEIGDLGRRPEALDRGPLQPGLDLGRRRVDDLDAGTRCAACARTPAAPSR
jgi:hypothetical protein